MIWNKLACNQTVAARAKPNYFRKLENCFNFYQHEIYLKQFLFLSISGVKLFRKRMITQLLLFKWKHNISETQLSCHTNCCVLRRPGNEELAAELIRWTRGLITKKMSIPSGVGQHLVQALKKNQEKDKKCKKLLLRSTKSHNNVPIVS